MEARPGKVPIWAFYSRLTLDGEELERAKPGLPVVVGIGAKLPGLSVSFKRRQSLLRVNCEEALAQ